MPEPPDLTQHPLLTRLHHPVLTSLNPIKHPQARGQVRAEALAREGEVREVKFHSRVGVKGGVKEETGQHGGKVHNSHRPMTLEM